MSFMTLRKRFVNIFFIFVLLCSLLPFGVKIGLASNVEGEKNNNEVLNENPITVEINGKVIEFDQPPVVVNGRTMVPLRIIFDVLGANMIWDQITKTVTATRGMTNIQLTIGSDVAYVNGVTTTLDSPAIIMNERILVPTRFIGESMGAKVEWMNETRTVRIHYNVSSVNDEQPNTNDPQPVNSPNPIPTPIPSVRGQILGIDGVGIPDLYLNVRDFPENLNSRLIRTDSEGYYSVDHLETGKPYMIDVRANQIGMRSVITHNGVNYCERTDRFTFSDNQLPTISLQAVQLRGKVVDVNSDPVMGMTVLIYMGVPVLNDKDVPIEDAVFNPLVNGLSTVTDAEGQFSLCGLDEAERYSMSVTQFLLADKAKRNRKVMTSKNYEFVYDSTMNSLPDYKVTYIEY